jgi:hypothetical protein
MDIIYELSDLTIIAAGDVDASARLAGLRESSRTPTQVVRDRVWNQIDLGWIGR